MTLTPAQMAQINNAADNAALGQPFDLSFPAGTVNQTEVDSYFQTAVKNAGGTVQGGADISTPVTSAPSGGKGSYLDYLQAMVNPGAALVNTVADKGTNITGWISQNAGNYGLVILGAVLVVGALLISQKGNIQVAVNTASKVAAVAA